MSRILCAMILAFFGLQLSGAEGKGDSIVENRPAEQIVPVPRSIHDPLEPVNRGIGIMNHGIMRGVIEPSSYVYGFVVREPIRSAISNAGHNLSYPVRLANNLLQAKWQGAGDETLRFLVNSTLGVGGLFDVASRFGIRRSVEDFGQTFGRWGWRKQHFVMLPLRGPSSVRDGIGAAADGAINPATYLFPASLIFSYNQLADQIEQYNAFTSSQQDPYSNGRDLWAWYRAAALEDTFTFHYTNTAAAQTLRAIFVAPADPRFFRRGQNRSIRLTNPDFPFPYTIWLQDRPAPVVYLLPGIGDHRRGDSTLALAELAYELGYSVVGISGIFNYEFIRGASTTGVPGYAEQDARDVYAALNAIHRAESERNPGRLGQAVLLGLSLGGFHTLFLASHPELQTGELQFTDYHAINPPIDLVYGMNQLDAFYRAPLEWLDPFEPGERHPNVAEVEEKISETLMKAVRLVDGSLYPESPVPYSDIEAKYILGAQFRLTLRDAIYVSQTRHNLGVLREPVSYWNRTEAYAEILDYSYEDYVTAFVQRCYAKEADPTNVVNRLVTSADLKHFGEQLSRNRTVYVVSNENDFLLSEQDVNWLKQVVAPDKLVLFPNGGHLGNLHEVPFLHSIVINLRRSAPEWKAEEERAELQ